MPLLLAALGLGSTGCSGASSAGDARAFPRGAHMALDAGLRSGRGNVNAALATHAYSASAVEGSAFKRRLLARNRIWTLARCLPRDIWIRDRASILAFDLLAAGHGTVTRDGASIRGRAAALAGMPARMRERRWIQSGTTVDHQAIADWIQPAVSSAALLTLRRLTARLAQSPSR